MPLLIFHSPSYPFVAATHLRVYVFTPSAMCLFAPHVYVVTVPKSDATLGEAVAPVTVGGAAHFITAIQIKNNVKNKRYAIILPG